MNKGWIGVDLDGTLVEYHGFTDEFDIGKPIPAMIAHVKSWLVLGKTVKIVTARVSGVTTAEDMGMLEKHIKDYRDIEKVRGRIQDWTEKHFGVRLPVTNCKDYNMIELWDDRAVQVIFNTGQRVDVFKDKYEYLLQSYKNYIEGHVDKSKVLEFLNKEQVFIGRLRK